jgi:uncharacterized protein (TIGR03435 family)
MFKAQLLGALVLASFLFVTACEEPQGQAVLTPWRPPASQPAPAPRVAESSLIQTRDPAAETTVQLTEKTGTLTATNVRMADLISVAYRTPESSRTVIPLLSSVRVVSATPLPAGRYDLRISIPGGKADRLLATLRKLLEEQFGISASHEMRESDVLVLTDWPGRPRAAAPEAPTGPETKSRRITLSGSGAALLAEQLEERMDQPIVNEAKRPGPYELTFVQTPVKGQWRLPDMMDVRPALRDQVGLDLVPARRTIEFVVVRPRG